MRRDRLASTRLGKPEPNGEKHKGEEATGMVAYTPFPQLGEFVVECSELHICERRDVEVIQCLGGNDRTNDIL